MSKKTFLLGAGFSKPFGGPLVSDLHDIVSEKPNQYYFSLGFEIRDYTLNDTYDEITITKDKKVFCTDKEQINFFEIYKSFLVSEYLKEFHKLPTYEILLEQMSKDTLLFDNIDYTNYNRKNSIISLGEFIKSDIDINDRYHDLIVYCIDFLTLLVFNRIQENIDIKKVQNPLLTEYIKKVGNRINILSLNYDNVVEDILSNNKITYSDGFESVKWDITEYPIYRFNADSFDNEKVNIFKLHGSINYGFVGKDTVGKYIKSTTVKFNTKDLKKLKNDFKQKVGYGFYEREFIIGSYNKSERYFRRTFIDLFNIGISKLNLSNTLIVIGYSFQDVSINLIISNWLNKSNSRKMIVINGYFNGELIPEPSGSAIFCSHLKDQIFNTNYKLEDITINDLEKIIDKIGNDKLK